MSDTLEATQIVFYGLGSAAIIVGALVSLRRFLIERPHEAAWDVLVEEGRLRAVALPVGNGYSHAFRLVLTNRSFAPQRIEGYWFQVFTPDQPDFTGNRFNRPPVTVEGVAALFGGAPSPSGSTVPPGGVIRVGQAVTTPARHTAARICYAFVGRKPRLRLWGFHRSLTIVAIGSQVTPLRSEDVAAVH